MVDHDFTLRGQYPSMMRIDKNNKNTKLANSINYIYLEVLYFGTVCRCYRHVGVFPSLRKST